MVLFNPGTTRLGFGGDPDLDPDSGIFRRNFTIAVLATVKALRHGFGNSPRICRLAVLKLNEFKGCLGGVLRSPSASMLICFFFDNSTNC